MLISKLNACLRSGFPAVQKVYHEIVALKSKVW